MHSTCMSLGLLPGPVMYGGQHVQVLHTSVTLSGASGFPIGYGPITLPLRSA